MGPSMDGIGMGNPKAKLTPARAGGSERNASPAITKARTTSFCIIKETRKTYLRIQETVRGANSCREGGSASVRLRQAASIGAKGSASSSKVIAGHKLLGFQGRAASTLAGGSLLCCDQARRLMAHEGTTRAPSRALGYESPSQFSREFKRLFGVTPLGGGQNTRARLAVG
jgi:hypothetical protein